MEEDLIYEKLSAYLDEELSPEDHKKFEEETESQASSEMAQWSTNLDRMIRQ